MFPNDKAIVIPSSSLFTNLSYKITLTVEEEETESYAKHSVVLKALPGMVLDVKVNSKSNKNGFIDYSSPVLFV